MGLSDFPGSCIIVLLLADSRCGPGRDSRRYIGGHPDSRSNRGSPGFRHRSGLSFGKGGVRRPVRCVRACMGSPTPQGRAVPRDGGTARVAFRRFGTRRRPGLMTLRGSIPSPHVPLSTLQVRHYCRPHMTRGRCDSLGLHRQALSSLTPHRLGRRYPKCVTHPPGLVQPDLGRVKWITLVLRVRKHTMRIDPCDLDERHPWPGAHPHVRI